MPMGKAAREADSMQDFSAVEWHLFRNDARYESVGYEFLLLVASSVLVKES